MIARARRSGLRRGSSRGRSPKARRFLPDRRNSALTNSSSSVSYSSYCTHSCDCLVERRFAVFFGFLDARYGLKVRAAVAKGAEAAVALDVAPYGHSLLIDPSRLRYTTTLFGYPLPVYTERHAKFTALTTKPFCRSILLLRTALHYTDIEAEYLHGTNDSLLLGAPHLVKQIYEALARNAKMPILSFDWLCDRLGFSTTSSITNIFALVTEAEKEIRDWSFPDWTKAPQPDPPVEEVAVRQYSAVRANSPLADIVTLAKAEKHGGGQIPWTDIPLRAQNFLLATFRLVDPARTPPSGLVSVRALLSEFGAVTVCPCCWAF